MKLKNNFTHDKEILLKLKKKHPEKSYLVNVILDRKVTRDEEMKAGEARFDKIPDRLRELRTKYNLSQKNVADMLGIFDSSYRKLEKEGYNITAQTLMKLALFYNCSMDYLVGLSDDLTPITGDKWIHVINGYYLPEVIGEEIPGMDPEE